MQDEPGLSQAPKLVRASQRAVHTARLAEGSPGWKQVNEERQQHGCRNAIQTHAQSRKGSRNFAE